jgi:hypothetical protein
MALASEAALGLDEVKRLFKTDYLPEAFLILKELGRN